MDNGTFNLLLRAYKEQQELNGALLQAVNHQTDVLSKCMSDGFHAAQIDRMKEHGEIKTKVNIGILQMLAIFASTILNLLLGR